jgi:DNA-binding Lrp family transcriptional regulator
MVRAYVLIQTVVGQTAAVAEQISTIDGVVSADDVTGPYDVIVRLEAQSVDDLGRLVAGDIGRVDGITRTLTCPVVHLEREA